MTAYLPLADSVDVDNRIYDNVYQSSSNTIKSFSRVINSNAIKNTMPSLNFGGLSSVDLPQNVLLSNNILTLKLEKSKIPNGAGLQHGWGYKAIRYVEYTFANSQILRYGGQNLLVKNLADCESEGKRSKLLNLAGYQYNSNTGTAPTPNTPDDILTATMNIYLPFSNMSSSRVIPYDSSLANRPINVKIEFVEAEQLFTWATADSGTVRTALPRSFKDAYMMQKISVFMDGPSDSMKMYVQPGGGSKYSYGYIYPQSFTSGEIKIGSSDVNNKVSFRLDNFLNGSLQSMDLWLERVTFDGNISNLMTASPVCDNFFYPMTNVQLEYAGNVIYRADDDTSQLLNLTDYTVSGEFDTTPLKYDITSNTARLFAQAGAGYRSQWTHIQLSQHNESVFTNLLQSGVSLVANQVMITFNTPSKQYEANAVGLTVENATHAYYRLRANYNYQAMVRTANGITDLLFMTPAMIASQPGISLNP